MFGKAKNGVSKAAEGLGYVNERGLKGTAEDLTEKAKDTLEEKLDGTRAKELAEAVKNPSEALEKQKEKASEVKEGLKDAYGEGQVNAAVKANTTSEKENQEGAAIPSAKDHQDELHSNENSIGEKDSEEGKNGQLPKTDPEQYRYKPNSDLENEKRISDLSKVNQEDKAENEDSYQKLIQNNIGIDLLTPKMKNAFQIYQNEIKKYKRMRIPSFCQMIMESKLELKNQRKLVCLRHKIYQ